MKQTKTTIRKIQETIMTNSEKTTATTHTDHKRIKTRKNIRNKEDTARTPYKKHIGQIEDTT